MGVLEGMTNLSTSRNIEILPTFAAVQFGGLDDTTGAFVNDRADPEGGLNFKYGVTSNLTADLTLNPDFSQIESDRPQIAVNQRFDLFFPELRPSSSRVPRSSRSGGPSRWCTRGRSPTRYTERSSPGKLAARRSA